MWITRERALNLLIVVLCLIAVALIWLLPKYALETGLVYKGF